jgi:hypothetical protein
MIPPKNNLSEKPIRNFFLIGIPWINTREILDRMIIKSFY